MTSTRLPGKVLLEAGGKSMLQHHIDRLRATNLPIILATTTNESDQPLVDLAADLGIEVFRGSEHDVLSRFAGAARKFELDAVVRVTSDCPLIDGHVVASGITMYLSSTPPPYVSNVIERTYPRGFDFEVFSANALYEAEERAVSTPDREHVTPFVRRHASIDELIHVVRPRDSSEYRVTLDTPEDFDLLSILFDEYSAADLSAEAIIQVLDEHPQLPQINQEIEQKKLDE